MGGPSDDVQRPDFNSSLNSVEIDAGGGGCSKRWVFKDSTAARTGRCRWRLLLGGVRDGRGDDVACCQRFNLVFCHFCGADVCVFGRLHVSPFSRCSLGGGRGGPLVDQGVRRHSCDESRPMRLV